MATERKGPSTGEGQTFSTEYLEALRALADEALDRVFTWSGNWTAHVIGSLIVAFKNDDDVEYVFELSVDTDASKPFLITPLGRQA